MAINVLKHKALSYIGYDQHMAGGAAGGTVTASQQAQIRALVNAGFEPKQADAYVKGTLTSTGNKKLVWKQLVQSGLDPKLAWALVSNGTF